MRHTIVEEESFEMDLADLRGVEFGIISEIP